MEWNRKPSWWLLYLTVPLLLGLLVLEARLSVQLVAHRILEFGIVLLWLGLMLVWVRANEGALIDEQVEKYQWTIEPDPAQDLGIPPFEDGCDGPADDEHRLEASAIKGRYN